MIRNQAEKLRLLSLRLAQCKHPKEHGGKKLIHQEHTNDKLSAPADQTPRPQAAENLPYPPKIRRIRRKCTDRRKAAEKNRLSRISAKFLPKISRQKSIKIRLSSVSVIFFKTFSIFGSTVISFFLCDNDIRLACLFHSS